MIVEPHDLAELPIVGGGHLDQVAARVGPGFAVYARPDGSVFTIDHFTRPEAPVLAGCIPPVAARDAH